MKLFLLILGWIFLIILSPFIFVGCAVAIAMFSAKIGFDVTSKILISWSEAIS